MTRIACMTVALAIGASGAALAQQAPSAAASPGAPATYKTNTELAAAIKKAAEARPDMSSANVKSSDRYQINVVRRGKAAGAIAHANGTELHHIMEGSGTLVTGGVIVRQTAEGGTAVIQGGESRHVVKGDVILIPENTPHWYKDVDGSITYLEVRFNITPQK